MQALKQSTAVTLKMGPFVSSADGVSSETGLTITQPDVRVSKNGGNFAQKSAVGTASHDEYGYYDISVSTSDTDTLGRLAVAIYEDPALPVWSEFMVMEAEKYDFIYGSNDLVVSAQNLSEVTGDTIGAVSAYNDISVGAVSAYNLDEVDINGQLTSATNLSEVTGDTIGAVSAYNLNEVDITGQSVLTTNAVSAYNLDEVDINGQTVSAFNLDEVTGDTIGAVSASNLSEVIGDTIGAVSAYNSISVDAVSAYNLSQVDINGQYVNASAYNLSEVDINGQLTSATNLSEVDITGQSVVTTNSISAYNLDEVDITGQYVNASAYNLDDVGSVSAYNLTEIDINGQTTSASNLSEVDITGQYVNASAYNLDEVTGDSIGAVSAYNTISVGSVSAYNLDEITTSADCYIALENYGVQTSAYADIIKTQVIAEINEIAAEVLSATVDGSITVSATLVNMLANVTGKIQYFSATDEYQYYLQDNSTSAYRLSGSNDVRARIE